MILEKNQEKTFTFDPTIGNLMNRTDEIQHLSESFSYDPVLKSRLTSWQVGAEQYTISYENSGNIINKSDVTTKDGVFNYDPSKIHQVVEIKNPTPEYSNRSKVQEINYNGFNKVKSIKQQLGLVQVELKFQYGTNNERIKTVLSTQGTPLETRYYLGDYETKKTGNGAVEKLHYIYGSDGLFAIIKQSDQTQQIYYILKDHQGSYNQITDKDGNTIERLSFDPWGRRRNASTWSYTNAPAYTTFNRGYTGHEHLDNFGLINMNGRMYDPSLGRFLSADPILQNPTTVQGHNRYSYVLNNPLIYTDPSGYKVKPAGWDAPWESSAYVNFGPKGGSLSGNYWAVDYRTTEGNWAAMSQSTFDNLYGAGKYEDCYRDIRLNLAISMAAPEDYTPLWNSNSSVNLYMVNYHGSINFISCLDNLSSFTIGTDNGLTFYNQKGERAGLTTFGIPELTGLPLSGQEGGGWLETANNYSGIATTLITGATEITNAIVRGQFKSATSWKGWINLRKSQQVWRTVNVLGKTGAMTLKITGATGGVLGGLSASYYTYKVVNQAYTGGLQNVNGWDVADATVGWVGTASAAALILGTSNPIGWAIIGIGAAGYGAFRAGQYIYENY